MNAIVGRALAVSAVAATLWPTVARGDEGYVPRMYPPPPVTVPSGSTVTYQESAPNSALLGSGVTMFGFSYGTSLLVATLSDRPSDQNLYVPIAGPWMDLTRRGPCGDFECGPTEAGNRLLLVASGLFQAAGAIQIVGAFLFPETRTVTRAVSGRVQVRPTVGLGSVGVTVSGSF